MSYRLVTQSCMTLCHPKDYSPPGSSVHGIFQARIAEWVAVSFTRGSSRPSDRTRVSYVSCICQAGFLPLAPPGRPWMHRMERGGPVSGGTKALPRERQEPCPSPPLPTQGSRWTHPGPRPTASTPPLDSWGKLPEYAKKEKLKIHVSCACIIPRKVERKIQKGERLSRLHSGLGGTDPPPQQ